MHGDTCKRVTPEGRNSIFRVPHLHTGSYQPCKYKCLNKLNHNYAEKCPEISPEPNPAMQHALKYHIELN